MKWSEVGWWEEVDSPWTLLYYRESIFTGQSVYWRFKVYARKKQDL